MFDFLNQLIADRQYGVLAILVLIATATGYLLGRTLKLANSCYHGRGSRKAKLRRNR